jgi:hypothetical protein
VTAPADLVAELARLPDLQRRDLTRAAGVERQRRIRTVVRHIRGTLLADLSGRKVAWAIADAAHDCHGSLDPSLRAAIKRELQQQLGQLEDFPGADRIRQLVAEIG